jgi:uncharacterized protein
MKAKPRLVLDTNVVVSALLWRGKPGQLIELAGKDSEGSDLDLLVDALPGTTLFDLGNLHHNIEQLLGIRVNLKTPGDLPVQFRQKSLLAPARYEADLRLGDLDWGIIFPLPFRGGAVRLSGFAA